METPDASQHAPDPLMQAAEARLGRVLREKWRLDRLLGVGGMAAVYEASHRNGNVVAIKVLHAELGVRAEIRARFLREGYVANKVGHAGAVLVLDDDVTEDGTVFLVMELLAGETLDARMIRCGGRLAVEDVLAAADQLLDTLAAAHDKGMVHRDLKPENLFVTREGVVKVLDFGIARLLELSRPGSSTQTGTLMGTPAFMAPEQARGLWDEVDVQSDLWAVGATMFTLLAGRTVHEARTVNEQLLAAMTQPAPGLREIAPACPGPAAELVDRALCFEKSGRWPDAKAMQLAVREAYAAIAGAPISSARTLAPPAAVVEEKRLRSGELAARGPAAATGAPVTHGRSGFARRGLAGSPVAVALGLLGAVGLGVALTLVATRHSADGGVAPGASSASSASEPSAQSSGEAPALAAPLATPDVPAPAMSAAPPALEAPSAAASAAASAAPSAQEPKLAASARAPLTKPKKGTDLLGGPRK